MPLKTPKFWYPKKSEATSLHATLLMPVSALYQAAHKFLKSNQVTQKAPIPLICVGNITAGGSGKTPVCIAIAELIQNKRPDLNVVFLTRGYGGKQDQPKRIEGHETASDVGDEPLILAKHATTVVSSLRHNGACTAHDHGAELIIMDDGLINDTLYKDLSLLVIDGETGIGNGKTLPSGPLREPFETGLTYADAIIIIGKDKHGLKQKIADAKPILAGTVTADTSQIDKTKNYIAFTGIALPQKFKRTLDAEGIRALGFIEFPDHHNFTAQQLEAIRTRADQENATLITTEKDYVRLSEGDKKDVSYLPIKIEFDKPDELYALLNGVIV